MSRAEWKLNGRLCGCRGKARFGVVREEWGDRLGVGYEVWLCVDCLPFWLSYGEVASETRYELKSTRPPLQEGMLCHCNNNFGDMFYCNGSGHDNMEADLEPQTDEFLQHLKAAGYDQLLEGPTPGSQPTTATKATTPTKDSTS